MLLEPQRVAREVLTSPNRDAGDGKAGQCPVDRRHSKPFGVAFGQAHLAEAMAGLRVVMDS